jgi:hypothetical protein
MTTPLSLGFASAYQKIEDSLPHTRFGISPVIRTGINDLSRGGETAFSQSYADDQMRRYMGKVKSEGLANSQYLIGSHPQRLTPPSSYVAPIFGEGQAYGLHGGAIDKQTQPLLAKIWANKANQMRALATPLEVGAPTFLPSESMVSFNSQIRDEPQTEQYSKIVNVFDTIMAQLSTGAIKKTSFLENLTSGFNLLKQIGWTMNEFEINEFIKIAKTWLEPELFDVIQTTFDGPKAVLVYQYISAIVETLKYIEERLKFKGDPKIIKEELSEFIKKVREKLRKGLYKAPALEARIQGMRRRAQEDEAPTVDELAMEFLRPEDLMTAQERNEFNGRGRKRYFNSIGSLEAKKKGKKVNESM